MLFLLVIWAMCTGQPFLIALICVCHHIANVFCEMSSCHCPFLNMAAFILVVLGCSSQVGPRIFEVLFFALPPGLPHPQGHREGEGIGLVFVSVSFSYSLNSAYFFIILFSSFGFILLFFPRSLRCLEGNTSFLIKACGAPTSPVQ